MTTSPWTLPVFEAEIRMDEEWNFHIDKLEKLVCPSFGGFIQLLAQSEDAVTRYNKRYTKFDHEHKRMALLVAADPVYNDEIPPKHESDTIRRAEWPAWCPNVWRYCMGKVFVFDIEAQYCYNVPRVYYEVNRDAVGEMMQLAKEQIERGEFVTDF